MLVIDVCPLLTQPGLKFVKMAGRIPPLILVPGQTFWERITKNLNSFMDISRRLV